MDARGAALSPEPILLTQAVVERAPPLPWLVCVCVYRGEEGGYWREKASLTVKGVHLSGCAEGGDVISTLGACVCVEGLGY